MRSLPRVFPACLMDAIKLSQYLIRYDYYEVIDFHQNLIGFKEIITRNDPIKSFIMMKLLIFISYDCFAVKD